MRIFLLPALVAATCSGQAFGTWTINLARSSFAGGARPKSLTVRIEPHPKGEVFTVDQIEVDSRTRSSSSVLYLDGASRSFQDFECSGTQSSRRVDAQTVEILRQCGNGEWTRFVRRSSAKANELVLEIQGKHANGSRFERRLVLEKQ